MGCGSSSVENAAPTNTSTTTSTVTKNDGTKIVTATTTTTHTTIITTKTSSSPVHTKREGSFTQTPPRKESFSKTPRSPVKENDSKATGDATIAFDAEAGKEVEKAAQKVPSDKAIGDTIIKQNQEPVDSKSIIALFKMFIEMKGFCLMFCCF